jgi:hypothetical protein
VTLSTSISGNIACSWTPKELTCNDKKDNDFDGKVDCLDSDCASSFNLQTDMSNCGACGTDCANLPHVIQVSCEGGHCIISPLSCAQGYYDIDLESTTGCEYACTKTNGGVENKTDGKDNDCDGELSLEELDMDEDTFTVATGDCNDNNAGINPNAIEICSDNIDNNCNGVVNEGCSSGGNQNIVRDTMGNSNYKSHGSDSKEVVTSTDPLKTQKTETTKKTTTTTTYKAPEVNVKVTKFPTTAVAIGTIAIVLIAGLAWYFMYFRPGQGLKPEPVDYTRTQSFNEQYPGDQQ